MSVFILVAYLFVCLIVSLLICFSAYLFVCLLVRLFICLSIYLLVCLLICLFTYLSVYFFVCLSLCVFLFWLQFSPTSSQKTVFIRDRKLIRFILGRRSSNYFRFVKTYKIVIYSICLNLQNCNFFFVEIK